MGVAVPLAPVVTRSPEPPQKFGHGPSFVGQLRSRNQVEPPPPPPPPPPLKWKKARTGHWGTEKTDELAKAGTVSSYLVCSLVPLNRIKNMINDKVNSLTQTRWNYNRHAHTDLILGNHHLKTLKILTNNLNNRPRHRTAICINASSQGT